MSYLCSENKGADQLRGHREADLRLCFRICRLLVFPCGGLIDTLMSSGQCMGYGRRRRLLLKMLKNRENCQECRLKSSVVEGN